MNINPPIRGQTYVIWIGLPSRSNPNVFQANPTLASGDAKLSKDGGSLANLGTLPTVTPASGKLVKVELSASEMDADNIAIILSDAAGDEWCDVIINIQPLGILFGGVINDASPTTTDFDTTLTGAGNDFFNNAFLVFTDGTLQGQSRKILDYVSTSGNFSFATAFTTTPADGSPFLVLGRSE